MTEAARMLVVGSVALDSVETPQARRDDQLGGSASFFATVASLIGPVRLVGVVGEDFPEEHVEFLAKRAVDLEGLQRRPGRTFRWSGRYADNMVDRETLDTQLNVFESFQPELPASYRDSPYVFLANIQPDLQLRVLEQVDRPTLVACDTMNFWMTEQFLPRLREVLSHVDVVFVNDEEARILSGVENLVRAASAIREMGVPMVVIKRGDAGAMLFDAQGIFWVPAFPLTRVVDPTGAGDCFAGGFISYLARVGAKRDSALDVRRAMVVGSATASFAVEAFSVDRFEDLTRRELLERCRGFADLVHFGEIEL